MSEQLSYDTDSMEEILARITGMEQEFAQARQENVALLAQMAQLGGSPAATVRGRQVTSTVDTRLIGKPLPGVKTDGDWPQWSQVFKAYLGAIDPGYLELIKRAEGEADTDNVHLDADEAHLSTQLYYILMMLLTEGRAAEKTGLVEAGEGLSLWRILLARAPAEARCRMVPCLSGGKARNAA